MLLKAGGSPGGSADLTAGAISLGPASSLGLLEGWDALALGAGQHSNGR